MKSLINTYHSLITDVMRLMPDVKGLDRDFVTIKARTKHEGISFLTNTLPAFAASFDLSLQLGQWTPLLGFKSRGSLPALLQGLTGLVFCPLTGILRDRPSVEAILSLRQICYLFKKLTLTDDASEILDAKAKSEFAECDYYLHGIFCCEKATTLSVVASYVLHSLDDYDVLNMRHGPGSVAEKLTPNQKWSNVASALVGDSELLDRYVPRDLFRSLSTEGQYSSSALPSCTSSRLISVKKNSSSRRTITIEPVLKQFLQQGLNDHLRKNFLDDPILRECMRLNDQTPNQQWALSGSRTGLFSTIDLSSASDRLSLRLVSLVFEKSPKFLSDCLLSRSNRTDKCLSDMNKHAGMGNATTFPIQTVVFSLIAICGILQSRGLFPSKRNVKHCARNLLVFGDDIVVPTSSYHQVTEWLVSFGLKVNQKKSCYRGFFRESCGVDAYKGVDVTPMYIQHRPHTSASVEAVNSLVSTSNSLWEKGYYKTATFIANQVERALGRRLPLVSRNSGCLGWHDRYDSYEFQRWNRDLHRPEVRGLLTRNRQVPDHIDGHPALHKFYHVPLLGRPDGHLRRSPRRFNIYHVVRWVRAC